MGKVHYYTSQTLLYEKCSSKKKKKKLVDRRNGQTNLDDFKKVKK